MWQCMLPPRVCVAQRGGTVATFSRCNRLLRCPHKSHVETQAPDLRTGLSQVGRVVLDPVASLTSGVRAIHWSMTIPHNISRIAIAVPIYGSLHTPEPRNPQKVSKRTSRASLPGVSKKCRKSSPSTDLLPTRPNLLQKKSLQKYFLEAINFVTITKTLCIQLNQTRERPQTYYKNNCFRELFCNNFAQDGSVFASFSGHLGLFRHFSYTPGREAREVLFQTFWRFRAQMAWGLLCMAAPIATHGQTLAVWILVAKLPSAGLNFAMDVGVCFGLVFLGDRFLYTSGAGRCCPFAVFSASGV